MSESESSKASGETLPSAVTDLNYPGVAASVARRIAADIDGYCTQAYFDGHRWHLGASLIGHECKRYLWYVFRWCLNDVPNPRQLRLFNRGHREEARYVEYLTGIGCTVLTEDRSQPQKPDGTYPQFRVTGANGHFGGSLDGIIKLPERYKIPQWLLGEFKTNGTGSSWEQLCSQTMPIAKPQHFAQTSTYGSDPVYQFSHVVYLNANKNDDSLHIELTKLDYSLGDQMRAKAVSIIYSRTAPRKLSENATFFKCKFCPAVTVCHAGQTPEKNCRSCQHAEPIENGEWGCHVHRVILQRDFVPLGCNSWKPITDVD